MPTALLIVLTLAVLLAVGLIIGSRLPRTRTAASRIRLRARAEEVWNMLTDFQAYPRWRMGLMRVEVGTAEDGRPMWTEVSSKASRIPFKVVEARPPSWLVTEIADETLPLHGRWTYRLEEQNGETMLTVTAIDRIDHPLLRLCMRYLLPCHGVLDVFLAELALKLGQAPKIEHVPLGNERGSPGNPGEPLSPPEP